MSDLPRKAVTRTAKLAALPLGFAGRATWGLGKRIGGKSAELVGRELQQRTAEQLFKVLGELKGGAMKFGQALSVFESALPEEVAGPYRAALTKLQEAAPPMPTRTVHAVLEERLGEDWRELFLEFEDKPVGGRLDRPGAPGGVARRPRGRGQGAVPGGGRGAALRPEPAEPLRPPAGSPDPRHGHQAADHGARDRVSEELDYGLEAQAQRAHAEEFAGDPDVRGAGRGAPVRPGAGHGVDRRDPAVRGDHRRHPGAAGPGGPAAGPLPLLRPRPHRTAARRPAPGQLPAAARRPENGEDGWRLGVLDFGTVDRLPGGLPATIGDSLRMTLDGEAEAVYELLRAEGFVKESIELDPDAVLDYLLPIIEPAQVDEFTFTRGWMRSQAARIADPRSPAHQLGKQLNLPPSYLLIHRVTLSTIGVLCQLGATVRLRDELEEWLPGFLPEEEPERGARRSRLRRREAWRGSPPGRVQPPLDRPEVLPGAGVAEVVAGAVLHGAGPGRLRALGRGAAAGAHDAGRRRVGPLRGAAVRHCLREHSSRGDDIAVSAVRRAQRTAGAGPLGMLVAPGEGVAAGRRQGAHGLHPRAVRSA